ncbi:MAG: hypothetical protein LBH27_01920 [Endomicrobium sp.]|jgi:thiamine-phosphate pyrophosphorylase|nr:hypothetical protein [Endomicrobium sp.]
MVKNFNYKTNNEIVNLKLKYRLNQQDISDNLDTVKKNILRVIDVNLNRCREGLRVVEDALRFVLNDSFFSEIRKTRHNIDKIFNNIYDDLLNDRDSFIDLGRQIHECQSKTLSDLIIANFKRAQESLRVLEEYSKIFFPMISENFKKNRYIVYDLEKMVYLKYKIIFCHYKK